MSVRPWLLAAALLLGGCVDGDDDGAASSQSACITTRTPVPIDEVTAFGFSGAQLFAQAEGSHTFQLTWDAFALDSPLVDINATPGQTTLSLRVTRTGGVSVLDQEPRMPDAAPCMDGVEAHADVEAVSADGALAETVRGHLFATAPGQAALDVSLPLRPTGSLRVDAAPSSGVQIEHLVLTMSFREGSLEQGLLMVVYDDGTGEQKPLTALITAMLTPLPTAAEAPPR